MFFDSIGKKIRMVMKNEICEFYGKLSDVKNQLDDQDFVFIHKSHLINFSYVIEYEYTSVKMSNGIILSISQQHRKIFREKLFQRRSREVDK